MLKIAIETDSKLAFWYYFSVGFSAFGYIIVAVLVTKLIDLLTLSQKLPHDLNLAYIILLFLGVRYLLNFVSTFFRYTLGETYCDFLFRYKLQNFISFRFYQKLSTLDVQHLEDPEVLDLIARSKDTMLWRLPDFLRSLNYFFRNLVGVIFSFILLAPFGIQYPIFILLSVVPICIFKIKYGNIQWSLYGSGAPQVRKLWYFVDLLSSRSALRESKIFQSSSALLKKYRETQDYLLELNTRPLRHNLIFSTLLPIIEVITIFLIAKTFLPSVFAGAMTVGSFILLTQLADSLLSQSEGLIFDLSYLYTNNLFIDHYFDVLSLKKLIHQKTNPVVFDSISPPLIEFKNVSFHYPNSEPVLNNVSFTIHPGENVALVGENGAGKSTIIKLLCRFYDVKSGQILINGHDIRDVDLNQWYKFIGTLFQDFVQYHFTIKENIALGNPEKNSEKEIIESAKKSGAYDFIKNLPHGFDTPLGREFKDGHELSGGQWQKLAISRAFYEAPPLLILDEPTSAIDAEAEFEIFNNLEKTYKDKSLILVSHRFSTVRNAQKIIVLEKGKITEIGSHDELLKHKAKYAQMFHTQAVGYQS